MRAPSHIVSPMDLVALGTRQAHIHDNGGISSNPSDSPDPGSHSVANKEVSLAIDCQTFRSIERCGSGWPAISSIGFSPIACHSVYCPVGADLSDTMVSGVGDEQIPQTI